MTMTRQATSREMWEALQREWKGGTRMKNKTDKALGKVKHIKRYRVITENGDVLKRTDNQQEAVDYANKRNGPAEHHSGIVVYDSAVDRVIYDPFGRVYV